jgi:hypothetical protein
MTVTAFTNVARTAFALAVAGSVTLSLPRDAAAYRTASGPRGGWAAEGPRGAVAVGPRGGAAAVGPMGNAGYRPGYPGGGSGYPAYRPPYAVGRPIPAYPGYAHPAPYGAAVVAGVAVGAVVGAAVTPSTAQPATVVVPPPAQYGGALSMGAQLQRLPDGCRSVIVSTLSYYQCESTWIRPYMVGPNVAYIVVPPP